MFKLVASTLETTLREDVYACSEFVARGGPNLLAPLLKVEKRVPSSKVIGWLQPLAKGVGPGASLLLGWAAVLAVWRWGQGQCPQPGVKLAKGRGSCMLAGGAAGSAEAGARH